MNQKQKTQYLVTCLQGVEDYMTRVSYELGQLTPEEAEEFKRMRDRFTELADAIIKREKAK